MGYKFIMQLVKEATREGALLDFPPVIKQELVKDVMAGGHLENGDHEMIRVFSSQGSKKGS